MAYNPGVSYDSRSIGDGILLAAQSISQGLTGYYRKQEQRKLEEAANEAVSQLFTSAPDLAQQIGVKDPNDKGAVKAVVKSLGGAQPAIAMATQLSQFRQQQKMAQQEIDRAATDALALQEAGRYLAPQTRLPDAASVGEAFNSGGPLPQAQQQAADPGAALAEYTKRGGLDARALQVLGGLAETQMQLGGRAPKPQMIFQSEAELAKRYPPDKFDYTMQVDPATGQVAVSGISPRAPQQTLPPGYEPDPAQPGAIRPIPGSEGDVKRQEEAAAKRNLVQGEIDRADVVLGAVRSVLPKIDGLTSSYGGTLLSKIPGTTATDVAEEIKTIKSQIGIQQLQAMRTASRNGASGFGQLTERELDSLQAALGSLSTRQSPTQLRKTLAEVERRFERWKLAIAGQDPDQVEPAETASAAQSILSKYGVK